MMFSLSPAIGEYGRQRTVPCVLRQRPETGGQSGEQQTSNKSADK